MEGDPTPEFTPDPETDQRDFYVEIFGEDIVAAKELSGTGCFEVHNIDHFINLITEIEKNTESASKVRIMGAKHKMITGDIVAAATDPNGEPFLMVQHDPNYYDEVRGRTH